MKICGESGRENDLAPAVCKECGTDLPPAGRGASVPRPLQNVRCPVCKVSYDCSPAVDLRGSFSWGVFLVGGILAVLFRNAGRPKKVQCNRCGALFSFRTPSSDLWLLVFWLWISPTIVTLIILVIMVLGSIASHFT